MKRINPSDLEAGMSVIFKPNLNEDWVVDIIGYVDIVYITMMSHGNFNRQIPVYPYNSHTKTALLLRDEHISKESMDAYKQNLKESYI